MRILHLSDPQFGPHHRFPPTGQPGSLAERLLADLRDPVDLVCVTGDLAELGKPKEYEAAERFLDAVREGLGLPRRQVLIVPGNHDVSWSALSRYQLECAERDEEAKAPFWPKWSWFKAFLDRWYGDDAAHFLPTEPWSWWALPELDLVVAGFNSTLPETDTVHEWSIGEAQARWFAERLNRANAGTRLGLVHHDLFHGADAATRERERLRGLPLTLLLHGHTHIQTTNRNWDVPVLGVGSLGIEREWREEDVANQYQLLHLEGGVCHRSLRRYAQPKEAFLDDDDQLPPGERHFRITLGADAPRFPAGHRERLADRVAEVLRLREPEGTHVTVLDAEAVDVRRGPHRQLIGVAPQVDDAVITRYLSRLADYRADDPSLPAQIVHRGEAAPHAGVQLTSLAAFQGIVDFERLRAWQAARIAEDPRYPPDAYIEQRVRIGTPHPDATQEHASALDRVHSLLTAPDEEPCLALLLAHFGTGKTYLIRQLARRLEREGKDADGRWIEGARVPLWIELRHLEKASSFEALLAAHLTRAGQRNIDHRQLEFLRREGRLVLLFDGFDELVLRVSYDRATEHLATLAAAAEGRARVVVTSRTEHFLRTADAEGALLRQLRHVGGLRILHLQDFNRAEGEAYLERRLGPAGRDRYARLSQVPNLADLARTPRMLEMIAELDDADLDAARLGATTMTAAGLYAVLVERWLRNEEQKWHGGGLRPVGWQSARIAVARLAEQAWRRGTEDIGLDELREVATSLGLRDFTPDEAARELGSGTLLVRDEEARFRFAHRSVLEFFIAEACSGALGAGEPPSLLDVGVASAVLIHFLGDLAGQALDEWARAASRPGNPEQRRHNALAVAAARHLRMALDLSGQDLRGRDDLRTLDLRGADLRGADLSGLDLSDVDLTGARLDGAKLVDTRLTNARLEGCLGLVEGFGSTRLGAGSTLPLRPEVGNGGGEAALAWGPEESVVVGGATGARLYDAQGRIRRSFDHPGWVRCVAFAPNGVTLATGGDDGTIRLWDARTGEPGAVLRGDSPVRQLVFSVDGGELASGHDDHTIGWWDLRAGSLIRTLDAEAPGFDLGGFRASDGALLALTADGLLLAWDPEAGQAEARRLTQWIFQGARFAPGGAHVWLLTFDSRWVCVDTESGEELGSLNPLDAQLNDWAHVVSPASNLFTDYWDMFMWAGVAGAEMPEELRNEHWLRELRRIQSLNSYSHLRWTASDALDVESSFRRWIMDGSDAHVTDVVVLSDGRRCFATHADGSLAIWDIEAGSKVVPNFLDHGEHTAPTASTDGRIVVFFKRDETACAYNPDTDARTDLNLKPSEDPLLVAYSPDGDLVAIGWSGQPPMVIDLRSNTRTVLGSSPTGSVPIFAFGGNSRIVAAGHYKGVTLWDTTTGAVVRTLATEGDVHAIQFSPDGHTLAAAGWHGAIRLWNPDSGALSHDLAGARGTVRALAFSPDGHTLTAAGEEGVLHTWDVASGALVRSIPAGRGGVTSLAYTRDGQRLLSGGQDGRVCMWDVASGRLLGWMASGPHGSVCVAPDGSYRTQGDVSGWFWIAHGTHRYEVGELERWWPGLRVPHGVPFPWGRQPGEAFDLTRAAK